MLPSHWFFWLFAVCFFIHEFWESFLICLNIRHTQVKQDIPSVLANHIDQATHLKSIAYNNDRARFGLIVRGLKALLLWVLILSGTFSILESWLQVQFQLSGLHHSVLYVGVVGFLLFLIGIPGSLYSQFVLEARYGFNKMTAKTFCLDLLKSLFLSALLGVPLLYLVFWLYQTAGAWWWLVAFAALFSFELLLSAVYPTFLAPLFNKFTPLEDGTLKSAIMALAKKIRFKLSGIYTIDGSRRSAHSNAYFAGIGRFRRIVLFDTLRAQLTEPEIIAVLGHEMGHNKMRHVQKGLILSLLLTFLGFWLLKLLITWPPFYQAFGAGAPTPHQALVLFALASGHFTFVLTPFKSWLSRRYEYAADHFAVKVTGKAPAMIGALVKLCKENLANLTPHPLYSSYYYSHPTTVERIGALQKLQQPNVPS